MMFENKVPVTDNDCVKVVMGAIFLEGISRADQSVLICLADHVIHGRHDTSQWFLAEQFGVSVRTVKRSISRLEKLGLIYVVRHPGFGNAYDVNWKALLMEYDAYEACKESIVREEAAAMGIA